MAPLSSANKLDFAPAIADSQLLPAFELRSVGAAFADSPASTSGAEGGPLTSIKLTGRAAFDLREGFDPIDASSTGRVVEGAGDAGLALRKGSTALLLTAGRLAWRAGLDNPLAATAATVGEGAAPSLKLTLAKAVGDTSDTLLAATWDLTQRKPELAVGWAGSTFTEQAAVVLHADPLLRTYKVSAAVAFPGPEWRETLLDVHEGTLEEPVDDGARHRLWAQHTVKDKQWGYRTRVGGAFDLGRLLNWTAHAIDTHVEPRVPTFIWRLPLLHRLYTLAIPNQGPDQVRYAVKGWDLEGAHEFGQQGVQLGLAKNWEVAALRTSWHTGTKAAAVQYARSGVSLTARIARHEGGAGWGAPSLLLHVEPLGVL